MSDEADERNALQRRIVAYHEAGHAVMVLACGFTILDIKIQGSEHGLGSVEWGLPKEATKEDFLRAALISSSGLAGDMVLYQKEPKRFETEFWGHFSDQQQASEHLRRSEYRLDFRDLLVFSMKFCQDNWNFVEGVAEATLAFDALRASSFDAQKFPLLPDNWLTILQILADNSGEE